jgi:hypothetical protein
MMQARVKGLVRQVFRAPSHSVALKHRRDLIDPLSGPVLGGHRVLGARLGRVRDASAISRAALPPHPHDESARAAQWRRTSTDEDHYALPDRAFVPDAAPTLLAATKHWRGIPMTARAFRQLRELRTAMVPAMKEDAVA